MKIIMYKVLWTGEYEKGWDKKLSEKFNVTRAGYNISGRAGDNLVGDELIEAAKDKDFLIMGYDPLTKEVLENLPNLKAVLSGRDGPEENIDIETCTKLGIPVFSGGGRCAHCVSELTLALMFNLARPIIKASNYIREKGWNEMSEMTSLAADATELLGKTLSVIGLGRNGRELAKIANGIGMNVIAYDPYVSKEVADGLNVTMVSLMDAMSKGDYVCVLARLTDETRGMIGREQIAAMKKTACFINTGRAALTDEDAVLDALEKGDIRAAALDVYSYEPIGKNHRVFTIPADKLIITPHIAGIALDRIPHQYENIFNALTNFSNGNRDIYNLYNKTVFDSPEFMNRGGIIFNSKTI